MTTGFTVAGLLAVGGALIVAIALPRRPREADQAGTAQAAALAAVSTDDGMRELAQVSRR